MSNLPQPSLDALAHSQRLLKFIDQQMTAAGGTLSFAQFMELALYAPGLGYYVAGSRKFGQSGDFVTAPEISPLFSQCLAQACLPMFKQYIDNDVLELGAGSGVMAADLLQTWAQLACLPRHYFILELSPDLKQRQQHYLQQTIPHLFSRIHWLSTLPESFQGVIIANEVLDAMPVERFHIIDGEIFSLQVKSKADSFIWHPQPAEITLQTAINTIFTDFTDGLPADYISEFNLNLNGWLQSLAHCLEKGWILLIDYGFPRHEFYHPQRDRGTLMCHYRHYAHDDPFLYPGLQDITAHVDFTAVADAGLQAGLQISGYTTQANFLVANGLMERLAYYDSQSVDYLRLAQQAKQLILPGEMGELFKIMALTKGDNLVSPVLGLDERYRL